MHHNALGGIVHQTIGQRGCETLEIGVQRKMVGNGRPQKRVARRVLIGIDVVVGGAQLVVRGAPKGAAVI